MEYSLLSDESKVKRIPRILVFLFVVLLLVPFFSFIMGLDFSVPNYNSIHEVNIKSMLVESEIRGYFRQMILQWTGFLLATITITLAFTQYKLSNDKVALIIGISILFSGAMEAIHTISIDGLNLHPRAKNNLDALVWTFSNSFSGIILFLGFIHLMKDKSGKNLSTIDFALVNVLLLCTVMFIVYTIADIIQIPVMWQVHATVARPYESIPTIIYLAIAIFIYPRISRLYPSMLSNSILYICLTQVNMSLYMMYVSHQPYDSAYNIAYFLKDVTYFIPCICLIINYILSYYQVLKAQKHLQIKQDELQFIATHDSLTNLFNRREFENLLEKSISNASRDKSSIALLLIDLDNFKSTNDVYGHIHGDEVLKQFANRLVLLTRKGDIACRVGGDEFTLISPNIRSQSSPRQLSERILNELNSPYIIDDKLITMTASIGISIFPNDGRTAEKLLIKADLAMYKAKSSGKNNYHFYTEELSDIQHRESEIEAHLRKAIQEDELSFHYQPKFNLISKEIVGAEILLRWNNKVLGNISPNEFIPIAERSGLIIDIGNWILKNSFMQIKEWQEKYKTDFSFSVNISPIQIINNQFSAILKKNLSLFPSPLENVVFEITENILVVENKEIVNVLKDITDAGIKIALDDFGKGYSSLNRLKTLPIEILKIDKDFISDILDATTKVALVDVIITLGKELNMEVVAEGIETNDQIEYLINQECYFGQGFYFSKPITASEFEELAFLSKK